jgi:hypothetical protein
MSYVLGVMGIKGAGKDTLAEILTSMYGFKRLAFADALYQEVADAFGVPVSFLQNRDTKETPLPELSMIHCSNADFITVLKEAVLAAGNSFSVLMPNSPRYVLQIWGTEFRRTGYSDSYWLDQVKSSICDNPQSNFVIADCRHVNEADFISTLQNGLLIRVRRPVVEEKWLADLKASGTAAHSSETALMHRPAYFVFENKENDMFGFRQQVTEFMDNLVSSDTTKAKAA